MVSQSGQIAGSRVGGQKLIPVMLHSTLVWVDSEEWDGKNHAIDYCNMKIAEWETMKRDIQIQMTKNNIGV
jgi:hypothetical protein